jgi:uncharacterized phage-associated protein
MKSAINIANYFLKKSFEDGIDMTPMKLIKLVYIAHGWHLGLFDSELISEPTEAWKYGPVVSSVYRMFKKYKTERISSIDFPNEKYKGEYYDLLKDVNTSAFLDKIWDVYKSYSGGQLSDLTHQANTPWSKTWNEKGGSLTYGAIIPNDVIKAHYKEKFNL